MTAVSTSLLERRINILVEKSNRLLGSDSDAKNSMRLDIASRMVFAKVLKKYA